jgi:hypothetical protein
MPNIQRAIELNKQMPWENVPLAEYSLIDCSERLSLLAAVAGIRPCAILSLMTPEVLAAVRDILISSGVLTALVRGVRRERPRHDIPKELSAVFDQEGRNLDTPVLWVCATPDVRQRIKRNEEPVAVLLGYPACCIEQDEREMRIVNEAFRKALVAKAAERADTLRQAIRENWKVSVGEEAAAILEGRRVVGAAREFPFIFHTPCDGCLGHADSPSARLNDKFSDFGRQVDPDLHAAILEHARLFLEDRVSELSEG